MLEDNGRTASPPPVQQIFQGGRIDTRTTLNLRQFLTKQQRLQGQGSFPAAINSSLAATFPLKNSLELWYT